MLPSNNNNQPKGVQEDERSLLMDYYVQKVSARLRQLRSPGDSDKKRWIWELLQNAKDCISTEKSSVDVEVIVEDDHIIFKHNGEPFSPKALNSLIWQKSGKDETNAESTGRFGTGFLTTHTLSKNVSLESVLIDTDGSMWGVNLNLCREGELAEELKEGIKKTINSVNYFRNPTNTWTIFKYQLKTQTNKESAAAGVNSLKSNIFFMLAFADKINSIKLVTNDKTLLVTKSEETTLEHLKIVRFSVYENDVQSSVSVIFASSAEYCKELSKKYKQDRQLRYSVAIQVSEDTKEVLPILADTPHLYCIFPLVGTEDFHFPVVVNSPDFEPNSERGRILLAGNEFDEEKQEITNEGINKMILSKAVVLYSEILEYLSANEWKNIHLLAKGAKKMPLQDGDFDKDWYKEKIQIELRRYVLDTAMVETTNGFQKLNDIYFPKGDKKDLKKIWEFTNNISPEKLPKLELIDEWSKLIWDECHSQTVKKLAKQVSEYQKINALNQDIDWLNNLLIFISEVDKNYLNEYALIPNINGDFRTLEYENLSQDNGLPNCSFTLLAAFGVDWKDIVVKNITAIKLPLIKGYKELSDEVNRQIKQKAKSKDDTLLNSILVLLSAIPIKNDNISDDFIEKRKLIWAFSRDIFKEEQPDTFETEGLDETLWDVCDEWIVNKMIKKVSFQNSINGLIELNTSLDVQWLNKFIGFTIPLTKKDLLKHDEYKILPNQYGGFCTTLVNGNSIPQELKEDVFINLGIDLKKELIEEQINSFVPEKLMEISEVATKINDLLNSKIEDEIKDAVVFRLISLQPSEQSIFQEKLWKFSRVMYGNKVLPNLVALQNSHSTLWNVANTYIINKIISDIEKFAPIETEEESKSSISQFAEYLSSVSVGQKVNWNDFAIIWLSDFIGFLSKHEKAIGVIVPNQYGNFCASLAKGNSIPKELKEDVFINLGIDLKKELIKEQIDSFIPEKSIEIPEVAIRINDLLDSDEIENEIKDAVVFRLISLQPSEKSIFQEELWKFSRVMYGNKVLPNLVALQNSHSTLWNVANTYLINKIISDIERFAPIETEEESKSSISQFAEYLSSISVKQKPSWNDFTIIWLSGFIDFLSKHEKAIGVIVPNQNDNFCKLDQLCKDEEIHEDLKDILSILRKDSDFRNDLIHSGISIKPTHPKKATDIARKINEILKIDYKAQRNDEQFKKAVKLLVVDWFNKPFYSSDLHKEFGYGKTDRISRELFEWSYDHRFELETNVLSSVEERKYLYGLNNHIREHSIPFEEVKIITQTEYNDLMAEVAKLKIETNTTESENLISKFDLTEDKIKLLLEIEEKAKQFEGTSNYLEQSAQAVINETGIKGEEIVYEYLTNYFGKNRVRWVSRSDKNDEGIEEYRYDFEVLEEDLKSIMWYIDAKATLTEERQSDKIPILIRKGTWDFIRESEADKKNIFLARVFGARNANAGQVQLLKIQYHSNMKA